MAIAMIQISPLTAPLITPAIAPAPAPWLATRGGVKKYPASAPMPAYTSRLTGQQKHPTPGIWLSSVNTSMTAAPISPAFSPAFPAM
jgi:hypothetical protein